MCQSYYLGLAQMKCRSRACSRDGVPDSPRDGPATPAGDSMNSIEDPTLDSDYRVPALQRGLWILQLFSSSERVLSMNDIAERLALSVSSIYRIVQTLNGMGYLKKAGKNTYELGPQVIANGFTYLA